MRHCLYGLKRATNSKAQRSARLYVVWYVKAYIVARDKGYEGNGFLFRSRKWRTATTIPAAKESAINIMRQTIFPSRRQAEVQEKNDKEFMRPHFSLA